MSRTYRRREYGAAFVVLFFLVIALSPIWLVVVLGILTPVWIAGGLVLALVASVRQFFRK